jgi:hypothetical protein
MKTKRVIIYGLLAALVIAYAIAIVPNFRRRAEWERTVAALKSLPLERLSTAARTFARDHKVNDSTVPLGSLLSAGQLRPEDLRGLKGEDATISVTAKETTPSEPLIRVRTSDGSDIVLMADGSIARMRRR